MKSRTACHRAHLEDLQLDPFTDPTPNSYSRRICSYSSTLVLQSNSPSASHITEKQDRVRGAQGWANLNRHTGPNQNARIIFKLATEKDRVYRRECSLDVSVEILGSSFAVRKVGQATLEIQQENLERKHEAEIIDNIAKRDRTRQGLAELIREENIDNIPSAVRHSFRNTDMLHAQYYQDFETIELIADIFATAAALDGR